MMNLQFPLVRRLRRDQFLRFERPRGLQLKAEQGALWVTVDGEPDDITIEAGSSRVFDGDAGLLVGAFRQDAVLAAEAPRGRPGWREWLGFGPHATTRLA
jgi:hypothetical protein